MKNLNVNRRSFIKGSSALAITAAMNQFSFASTTVAPNLVGISVASYWLRFRDGGNEKYPQWKGAYEMAKHCQEIGAGGAQVSISKWDMDYAKKMRKLVEQTGMWLEGSISLPKEENELAAFDKALAASKEAGIEIIRAPCLHGRRYMSFKTKEEWLQFKKQAMKSIRLSEAVARKNGVKIAIENHKDWTADELVGIMKSFDSPHLGVNLDTGNNLSFLEDPYEVVDKLAPYALTTHFKDMGIERYPDGFLLSEVPYGQGFLDLNRMMMRLRKHKPDIKFNLEMMTRDPLEIPYLTDSYWQTFDDRLGKDLSGSLRILRENYADNPLPRVEQKSHVEQLADEEDNQLACLDFAKSSLQIMG
ncbi:sugar phosphate isomerase/epimerase [Marinilongibacter aquaticus]|uniref:sugar phosphate isomerase/epimerase family protein n=1 Tax=Marinilongibacter aquaticus TaxID=2975157 RepID=UPI0021BDDAD2|nr:TIM barrel protein [Marinilongibacter aquaticus]UBM58949.1 sugar phosphate isomerase/epimerase [Marinilongibacter aquaticus]